MAVKVVSMQGGGGGRGATRFSDTLLSPDQPFGFGNQWAIMQNLVNPPLGNAFAGVDVAAAFNRGATGMSMTNPGAGGFTPVVYGAPIPINWGFCYTRSQFAEFKIISNPAGIGRPAVCCFFDPNGMNLYNLQLQTEAARFSVDRINNTLQTNLIPASVTTAYALNDVLRLEADTRTTPGTTILTAKKNGVTIASFNDNSGLRLTQGFFGLGQHGCNPAVVSVVSNFSGGIL